VVLFLRERFSFENILRTSCLDLFLSKFGLVLFSEVFWRRPKEVYLHCGLPYFFHIYYPLYLVKRINLFRQGYSKEVVF